jgi:hypothetical protein
VDEGGELARSKSFMMMCFDKLELTVESTGGYNSTANGKVEGGHQPAKGSVSLLYAHDSRKNRQLLVFCNEPSNAISKII